MSMGGFSFSIFLPEVQIPGQTESIGRARVFRFRARGTARFRARQMFLTQRLGRGGRSRGLLSSRPLITMRRRRSSLRRETIQATATGLAVAAALGALILLGSRNLSHFDAALVAYTFASLLATFGLVFRYAMWLQRPPTAMDWRRGWQTFFQRGRVRRNLAQWPKRILDDILLTRFIWRRDRSRAI